MSESIIMGIPMKIGTGAFQLLHEFVPGPFILTNILASYHVSINQAKVKNNHLIMVKSNRFKLRHCSLTNHILNLKNIFLPFNQLSKTFERFPQSQGSRLQAQTSALRHPGVPPCWLFIALLVHLSVVFFGG